MNIEINLMEELFRTQILPAALQDQKNRAKSLIALEKAGLKAGVYQSESLSALARAIDQAIADIDDLEKVQKQTHDLGWEAKGKVFCDLANPKMERARKSVDRLETLVDNSLWPLPKYRELLFCI